jgi:hypothetical protein
MTNVAALLEKYHLSYGLGGYWEASVLTVETGGAVTIRAVEPACLQPYPWESKQDWYAAKQHVANFILLSNLKGYFTQFSASGPALLMLNTWSRPPLVKTTPSAFYDQPPNPPPTLWPAQVVTGGYHLLYTVRPPAKIYDYVARVYPMNLLTRLPRLLAVMNVPPTYACGAP